MRDQSPELKAAFEIFAIAKEAQRIRPLRLLKKLVPIPRQMPGKQVCIMIRHAGNRPPPPWAWA